MILLPGLQKEEETGLALTWLYFALALRLGVSPDWRFCAPAMRMFDAFCVKRGRGESDGQRLCRQELPGVRWGLCRRLWLFWARRAELRQQPERNATLTRFTGGFGAGDFSALVLIGINFPAGCWGWSADAPGSAGGSGGCWFSPRVYTHVRCSHMCERVCVYMLAHTPFAVVPCRLCVLVGAKLDVGVIEPMAPQRCLSAVSCGSL